MILISEMRAAFRYGSELMLDLSITLIAQVRLLSDSPLYT